MVGFCCHGNQTRRQNTIILAILNSPYQNNILTKLESNCFSGFEGGHLKIPFLKFNVAMATQQNGHWSL